MQYTIGYLILLGSTFLWPLSAWANPGAVSLLEREVIEYRLPNGMRWLFLRQRGTPVFTGVVVVKVGGIEERPGKTGLAHMFEHMAFKGGREIGTKDFAKEAAIMEQMRAIEAHIGKMGNAAERQHELERLAAEAHRYVIPNEIWHLFHRNGAEELNATTSKDVTSYFAKMPTNMLGLWTYLTAEMIGFPILREFHQERQVVMEERRSSVDTRPQGKLYEALMRATYTTGPYRWMAIGSMEDVGSLTIADAEAFHHTYYRPDRMVGVIVGNFDVALAKTFVRRFFGRLPVRHSPPLIETIGKDLTGATVHEPPQDVERRVQVIFDAEPTVMIAYHKPRPPHRDDFVFDVVTQLLCDGTTSRLERRLVQDDRIARSVDCESGAPGLRLDNLFLIEAQPIAPHTLAEVEAAIEEELTRLRDEPVAPEELDKVRTNIEADFLWGISSNEGLAHQLAYFESLVGDWRYIFRLGDVIRRVTAADIQRVAREYLVPTKRTVAELVKR